MAGPGKRWRWVAVAVVVVAAWALTRGGHGPDAADPSAGKAATRPSAASTPPPTPTAGDGPATAGGSNQDPAHFAGPVRTYAGKTGVNPVLLMAILYNESYKPHDPAVERAWQRVKPDAAFGVANMHQATFDETRQGRDFAGRSWQELPDHPDLAIEAAAWYLRDLATTLPGRRPAGYTRDELLALGYNTGPANMRAFARGVTPGDAAQSYLDRLRGNWAQAARAVGAAR